MPAIRNRSDGAWFTVRMEVGLPTCAIHADSGGVMAHLNEDQKHQFAEKCRENSRVRRRIISVCFLSVFVMIIFVIRDPSSESSTTEIVQYLCTGTLLIGVLFLAGQNLTENRCPACNAWLGRHRWPHPDRGSMRFCSKCGVEWFSDSESGAT